MNGELANLVALALYGSAWLADPRDDPPSLQANTTFRFVGRVGFGPVPGAPRELGACAESATWFTALRAAGVTRLWLEIPGGPSGPLPAHAAAAFVNSGGWRLLADGPHPSLWTARWEVADREAADSRIWAVDLAARPISGRVRPARPPLDDAVEGLVAAVVDARDFAREQHLDRWAAVFDGIVEQAGTGGAEIPYHADLVPPAVLGVDARHVLAIAVRSWVFGGMGSWNDVGVADRAAGERLERVTSVLHSRVLGAVVAATNSPLH